MPPLKTTTKPKLVGSVSPTALIILDGFGLGDLKAAGNAITLKTAPNIFSYLKKYSHCTLKTYGRAAGLLPHQPGNSEAGHMNIGAGRIVNQDLVVISDAIDDGTFYKNPAFRQALFHVKKYKTTVHVMGLLTDGNSAHASPEHLYALLELFRRQKVSAVYIHLFTDGRDSLPHGASQFIKELQAHMLGNEKVATVMGRFYAMDRNKNWDRTQLAYDAMVLGKGKASNSVAEAVSEAYARGESDEFILPTVILEKGKPVATIKDNDAVFFFNARSDRARQITKAFAQEHFEKANAGSFKRKHVLKNTRFVAMTDFGPDLPSILTAFPSPDISNCLPKVIGEKYKQLYISETEKYAHVTYFINGGYADPLNGEDREMIKSANVHSYVEKPEMMSRELADKITNYFAAGKYNFICVNFPNADMVGHTGDLAAAKKAVMAMDVAVKRIVDQVLALKGQVLITADHGNADIMIDPEIMEVMTEHTKNPVPLIMIRPHKKKVKMKNGILADVAPTLLKMMDIVPPSDMTGKSLF